MRRIILLLMSIALARGAAAGEPQPAPAGLRALGDGACSVSLAWDPQPQPAWYRVLRASSPEGPWEALGDTPLPRFDDLRVAGFSTYYYSVALGRRGQQAQPVSVTTGDNSLPAEWQSQDLGDAAEPGSASWCQGSMTLAAQGPGRFAFQVAGGDFSLAASLVDFKSADRGSLAGLMVREDLSPDARQIFLAWNPKKGLCLSLRRQAGTRAETLAGPKMAKACWLKLVKKGQSYSAYASADGKAWIPVQEGIALDMPKAVCAGLAACSSRGRVQATFEVGNVRLAALSTPTPPPADGAPTPAALVDLGGLGGPLAAPWRQMDVSAPVWPGACRQQDSAFILTASSPDESAGPSPRGDGDGVHFVYQDVQGDGSLVLRLKRLENGQPEARIGLMLRQSLASDAKALFLAFQPGAASRLICRAERRAAATEFPGPVLSLPCWLKLEKAAGMVSAFASADGAQWSPLASLPVQFPEKLLAGFAMMGANQALPCEAEIDQVAFNFSSPQAASPAAQSDPAPQEAAIGSLPRGWQEAETGGAAARGAGGTHDGAIRVSGGPGGQHFAYRFSNGDGEWVARLKAAGAGSAGLMLRAAASPEAPYAYLALRGDCPVFSTRRTTGGRSQENSAPSLEPPCWLKISRSAYVVRAWDSADGEHWTLIGSDSLPWPPKVLAGLAAGGEGPGAAWGEFDKLSGRF